MGLLAGQHLTEQAAVKTVAARGAMGAEPAEPEPEPEPEPQRASAPTSLRTAVSSLSAVKDDDAGRAEDVLAKLRGHTQPKEAWENRLRDSWRGKDGGAEVRRRAELLSRAPIFANCSNKELRTLAVALEQMNYADGEVLFAESDAPNGVYVLEEGACAVHVESIGVVSDLQEPGTVFGELCMFLDTKRTASIVATAPTRCLRCSGADAMKVMERVWGDREELEARAEMLASVELFSDLKLADRLMLATGMTELVYHRPGVEIVQQGKRGENMFFVKVGALSFLLSPVAPWWLTLCARVCVSLSARRATRA